MKTHVVQIGGPCVNHRTGCIGRLRVETVKHRDAQGAVTLREAIVCSRCGQGHGRP